MTKSMLAAACLLCILQPILSSQCCINFDATYKKCIECPEGMHLYKGNCIYNVDHCLQYISGIDCRKCQQGFKLVQNQQWIECHPFSHTQTDEYLESQLDPSICEYHGSDSDNLFALIHSYFTAKQNLTWPQYQLVKVKNKIYSDGKEDVTLFYKDTEAQAQGQVKKAKAQIIADATSFEVISFGDSEEGDIDPKQILIPPKTPEDLLKQQGYVYHDVHASRSSKKSKAEANGDSIKDSQDFNFEYQGPQSRNKDLGFLTADEFIRLSNDKDINEETEVTGCFVKSTGLKKQYKIFYKNPNKDIFRGEVIYDVVRRRAYILGFSKEN